MFVMTNTIQFPTCFVKYESLASKAMLSSSIGFPTDNVVTPSCSLIHSFLNPVDRSHS